jgi:hypothetical protein
MTQNQEIGKKVVHSYTSGKFSTVVVIPIEIARRHGLDKPSNVIVEDTSQGILLKKLKV